MKIKKKAAALATALAATVGVVASGASPVAAASVDGTVECFSGGQVSGMWLEVTAGPGTSGFADLTFLGGLQWDYYYDGGFTSSTDYYVSVGCGLDGDQWDHVTYGPTVTGTADQSWICFPGYSGIAGGYDRCVSA